MVTDHERKKLTYPGRIESCFVFSPPPANSEGKRSTHLGVVPPARNVTHCFPISSQMGSGEGIEGRRFPYNLVRVARV